MVQTNTNPNNTLPIYECDHCGLCCRNLIVEADALDVMREPRIEEVAPPLNGAGKRVSLPLLETTWVLAAVKPCPFLDPSNHCGIYATRPTTCVSFAAGSTKCQELRTVAGLPQLLPINRNPTIVDQINAELIIETIDQDMEQQ